MVVRMVFRMLVSARMSVVDWSAFRDPWGNHVLADMSLVKHKVVSRGPACLQSAHSRLALHMCLQDLLLLARMCLTLLSALEPKALISVLEAGGEQVKGGGMASFQSPQFPPLAQRPAVSLHQARFLARFFVLCWC